MIEIWMRIYWVNDNVYSIANKKCPIFLQEQGIVWGLQLVLSITNKIGDT